MSRGQIMSMLRRQVAAEGGCGDCPYGMGTMGGSESGGVFTEASRAGLAAYRAFRAANPGLSREELSAAWRRHKMGGALMGGEGGTFTAASRAGLSAYQAFRAANPGLSREELSAAWRRHKMGGALMGGFKGQKAYNDIIKRSCAVEPTKKAARKCRTSELDYFKQLEMKHPRSDEALERLINLGATAEEIAAIRDPAKKRRERQKTLSAIRKYPIVAAKREYDRAVQLARASNNCPPFGLTPAERRNPAKVEEVLRRLESGRSVSAPAPSLAREELLEELLEGMPEPQSPEAEAELEGILQGMGRMRLGRGGRRRYY